jgi:Rod binding domain-containing protein
MTAIPTMTAPTPDLTGYSAKAMQNKANAAGNKDAINKVAQDFEAVFLTQMFQHMFNGLDADPLFGGGQAENTYRSLMLNEYGKEVAKNGGVGLADHVSRTLLAAQEV